MLQLRDKTNSFNSYAFFDQVYPLSLTNQPSPPSFPKKNKNLKENTCVRTVLLKAEWNLFDWTSVRGSLGFV